MDESIAKEWLKSAFSFSDYELAPQDEGKIEQDKAGWIAGRLFAKDFRKAPVHPETKADMEKKIKLTLEENTPFHFIFCFGGYKNFWNPSYPEADFSELFNLRFLSDYIAPLAKIHEPGVILDYESEDVIMTAMDNYPVKDLDRYAQSFDRLIKLYSESAPSNVRISLVRAKDQVPGDALWKRIGEYLPNTRKEWSELPKDEIDSRLAHSYSNMMWKGEKDLTKLNETERKNRVLESKIVNETYYAADYDFRKDYFVGGNHIPLVGSFGTGRDNVGHWLTLGSTYSSMVDFWVGRGILEIRNGKAVERIVSHSQYEKIKDKLQVVDALKDSPIKNLRSVEVGENIGIGEAPKKA